MIEAYFAGHGPCSLPCLAVGLPTALSGPIHVVAKQPACQALRHARGLVAQGLRGLLAQAREAHEDDGCKWDGDGDRRYHCYDCPDGHVILLSYLSSRHLCRLGVW